MNAVTRIRVFHLFLLGSCLALFVFSATTDLLLPGPQYDEASHAALTLDMLKPENPFSPTYTFRVFGQPLPFGTDPHTGATKAYFFYPFFRFLGPSVEIERCITILLGSLALLFCYLFMRQAAGPWSAFWTLLLLSTDSSFIFYSKLDAGPIIEKLMWMMLCLWSFLEWQKRKKGIYLFLGLSGTVIGMYSHIAFIWFILASLSASFLVFRKEVLSRGKKEWISVTVTTVFLLTFFLYWLIGARDLLDLPVLYTVGVFQILGRLSTQGGIIPDVLMEYFQPLIHGRPLTVFFFFFAALFTFVFLRTRFVKFTLVIIATLFIQMCFTPGAILPHRIMMLYIFFPILGGVSVAESLVLLTQKGRLLSFKRFFSGTLLVLTIFSLGGQVLLTKEITQAVRRTGGSGPWSDAIYHLANFLKEEKWERVVCVDWGFRKNLFLLTKGKVLLEEPFWQWEDEGKMEKDLMAMSRTPDKNTLFLLHPEVYWVGGYPSVEQFEEIVQQSGARAIRKKTFYEKSGRPVYFAYVIEPSK